MSTRSYIRVGARPAFAGLAALALAAACSSTSSSPSPGTASAPAFTAHPTSALGTPTATLPETSLGTSPSPAASPTGALAECTTVASGLLNPRGITIADDGTIYVAEAGTGGTEPDFATAPVGSPGASLPAESLPALGSPAATMAEASPGSSPAPVTTHGETGQVTKIATDGTQSVLVSGLTSYNFMGEVVGPAGVVAGKDGTVYLSIGGPGPGTAQFVPHFVAG